MLNKRPGSCRNCGTHCAPGEANLHQGYDDDTDRTIWLLFCVDKIACDARKKERAEAARKEREAIAAASQEARAANDALIAAFVGAEFPAGSWSLRGEEIGLGGGERIYGGGRWAVIESDEDRTAPDSAEIEAARAESARLRDAADAAIAARTEFAGRVAPREPAIDGLLYGAALERLTPEQRATYRELNERCERLCYTKSSASYHHADKRLRELEYRVAIATYPRSIWLVQNNGHDGDDWSRNNVRTGGAGAMGVRKPHTAELEALVRRLAAAELALSQVL